MAALLKTDERVEVNQKSYQPEAGSRDLTKRLSGRKGQRVRHRGKVYEMGKMRDEMQQKDLRIKFTIEKVESRHDHRWSHGG